MSGVTLRLPAATLVATEILDAIGVGTSDPDLGFWHRRRIDHGHHRVAACRIDRWLAGMVMGGRGFGLIGNIIVGVLGALLGGFIGSTFFGWSVTGFDVGSVVLAFLGAILLLLILRMIPGRQPFER
jgi:uncharacterized membrane protein YeaQ/YmgE (transglycosylase-associated protein family)